MSAPCLKAYARRTILEAARDYSTTTRRTPESTRGACMDAMQGTNTGWWNDLIYTADMLDMASRYRKSIRKAVREYLYEIGQGAGETANPRDDEDRQFSFGDVIAATAERRSWDDYQGRNGATNELEAEALLFGLRFAVEWYAGEVSRDLCPDL